LPGTDTFLNAGEVAFLGRGGHAGVNEIQVDIDHAGEGGRIIEECLTFEAGLPEVTFDVVFFIGSARDEFIELSHEPAEVGEAAAEDGDTLGAIGEGRDLEVERDFFLFWRERNPAGGDFSIGPGGGDIGAEAENVVEMGIHDGIGDDIDGEDGGEEAQPVENPDFTVREVAAGYGVEAAEKGAADAAGVAVVDPFFTITDVLASG